MPKQKQSKLNVRLEIAESLVKYSFWMSILIGISFLLSLIIDNLTSLNSQTEFFGSLFILIFSVLILISIWFTFEKQIENAGKI